MAQVATQEAGGFSMTARTDGHGFDVRAFFSIEYGRRFPVLRGALWHAMLALDEAASRLDRHGVPDTEEANADFEATVISRLRAAVEA